MLFLKFTGIGLSGNVRIFCERSRLAWVGFGSVVVSVAAVVGGRFLFLACLVGGSSVTACVLLVSP